MKRFSFLGKRQSRSESRGAQEPLDISTLPQSQSDTFTSPQSKTKNFSRPQPDQTLHTNGVAEAQANISSAGPPSSSPFDTLNSNHEEPAEGPTTPSNPDIRRKPTPSQSRMSTSSITTQGKSPLSPQYTSIRAPHPYRHSASSTSTSQTSKTTSTTTSSKLLTTSPSFALPDLPWLCGTWYVVHSTLPMWKNKRNVRITYTRLSPGDKLDDLVRYQEFNDTEVKEVRGIDTPVGKRGQEGWKWRGRGWLKVASSRWEVIGWAGGGGESNTGNHRGWEDNEDEGIIEEEEHVEEREREQWIITYFAKTLFTPAGIDVYARTPRGLSEETMEKLKRGLARVDRRLMRNGMVDPRTGGNRSDFGKLVEGLFEIKMDKNLEEVI